MESQLQKIAALPQKDKVSYQGAAHSPLQPTDALPRLPPQTAACLSLLSSTLSSSSSLQQDLAFFLDAILHADFPQIVARQALSEYVANLKTIADEEKRKEVMAMSLPKMQQRVTTFEEQVSRPFRRLQLLLDCPAHPRFSQVCSLREQYAELLENDEEYSEAAKVLMGIPLESGGR